jgi:hypothetical protein
MNPYEPPFEGNDYLGSWQGSVWKGPLLSLSTTAFLVAASVKIVMAAVEDLWMSHEIVHISAGVGVICLCTSFYLHRVEFRPKQA